MAEGHYNEAQMAAFLSYVDIDGISTKEMLYTIDYLLEKQKLKNKVNIIDLAEPFLGLAATWMLQGMPGFFVRSLLQRSFPFGSADLMQSLGFSLHGLKHAEDAPFFLYDHPLEWHTRSTRKSLGLPTWLDRAFVLATFDQPYVVRYAKKGDFIEAVDVVKKRGSTRGILLYENVCLEIDQNQVVEKKLALFEEKAASFFITDEVQRAYRFFEGGGRDLEIAQILAGYACQLVGKSPPSLLDANRYAVQGFEETPCKITSE